MVRLGTMRNGVIVPDEPDTFPEGTRITLDSEDDDAWPADCPHPPSTETREEFLQGLRDDYAKILAGDRGMPVDEAFALIRLELNLPPEDAE